MTMPFKYKFKTIGISDYEVSLNTETSNRMIDILFNQSKKKLLGSVTVTGFDLSQLNKFDIDPRYYNFLKTSIRSQLNEIARQVHRDKIKVLNSAVTSAYFERKLEDPKTWVIKIIITGQYLDDRIGEGGKNGN